MTRRRQRKRRTIDVHVRPDLPGWAVWRLWSKGWRVRSDLHVRFLLYNHPPAVIREDTAPPDA